MNSSPIVKISKVPDGDGGRVIAQALSNSPLKFVSSIHGTYAVAWRTFKSGKPNVDDGKMWLLKKVKEYEYEYEIIQERSVFYANKLAVSENGHIAWVRSEGNRTKIQKFKNSK